MPDRVSPARDEVDHRLIDATLGSADRKHVAGQRIAHLLTDNRATVNVLNDLLLHGNLTTSPRRASPPILQNLIFGTRSLRALAAFRVFQHERVDRGRKLLRGDRDLASARSVARHILASHSDKRAQRLPCVRFGPELRKFPLQAQP